MNNCYRIFALTTLGDVTQIIIIIFVLQHPRCLRQVGGQGWNAKLQTSLQKNFTNLIRTLGRKKFGLTYKTKNFDCTNL